ncbi:hypothetical protein [Litoreibacter roseus]|uniref:Uncharacterized protein n=1 Tax=Litoreibacter roseus TaxID=2601869 RepID=A0A6N6JGI0_9RHOB|nr:hypothetical protein [Litoreibacter roseus]GFE65224.1 hypothetical protein KIN_22980 [Litoreibacter roseus]GFE66522.1 hypothetical protein KIN_35960 [Litoreibacter roseus]
MLKFTQLNADWNAEPNAPDLRVEHDDTSLVARFRPNALLYPEFERVSFILVRFENCERYRITSVNDHGWYDGRCRFSGLAPAWGEFYEISGNTRDDLDATPWIAMNGLGARHFHFYFRDEALEVKALDWSMQTKS